VHYDEKKMTVEIGKAIPNITLPANGGKTISLSDYQGQNIIIYFYPKDSTPGCTTEGQNFRDMKAELDACNTVVLGASKDSVRRHDNFIAKQEFNFDLLSDEEEVLCQAFDVIKLKKLYGKEYMGIERSTFLIDAKGVLRQDWRKVKVKGHADEVLAAAQAL
jgi:peroxiredoxin Q/BCP